MSLMDDHCGECGCDPCVCHAPEQDEEEVEESPPRELVRANAGVKRPLFASQFVDDEAAEGEDGEDEIIEHHRGFQREFQKRLHCDEVYSNEPDLDAYFGEFGLSAQSRIAMCRTYANYLTQKLRSSGKLGPARPKKK